MTKTIHDKAIEASARRLIELANDLPEPKRRDFVLEAATILKLIGAPANKTRTLGERNPHEIV